MNKWLSLPSQSAHRLLIDVIAILSIVLIGVVGYKLSALVAPKADRTLMPAADCNLHKASCSVSIDSGKLTLNLSPTPIPLIKPIQIEAHVEGIDVLRIDADFAGIGMNMGLNRPQLQEQGKGRFLANTTLPVCITGSMQWELTLLVETNTEQILIPFRFSTPDEGANS
jgi:hypothetical protein